MLGQLRHPGIGQIYEAGALDTPAGRQPYFALELTRGRPLLAYADEAGLGPRARLELVAQIADAVQHAHQKGVVHRDLKPANILVDETGQPKILDFGVARVTDADLQTIVQTGAGQLVGTVPYMSPEQIAGDATRVDPRSDVYSLGVVLYELLTGRLPHDVRNRPIPEAARIIRDEEPSRLSALNPALRGDIETIVAKALEKDRSRRYASAADFAADIRRYLRDEPLVARPASALYQLHKFARRHKTLVGGAVATLAALAIGLVGTTWFALREAAQHRLADAKADEAQRQAYRAGLAATQGAMLSYDVALARRSLTATPAALRGWEWRHLSWLLDRSLQSRGWPVEPVTVLAAPDRGAVLVFKDGRLEEIAAETLQTRRTVVAEMAEVTSAALAPAGATVLLTDPTTLALVRLADARLLWRVPVKTALGPAAFSPDGGEIAIAPTGIAQLQLLAADTGALRATFPLESVSAGYAGFDTTGTIVTARLGITTTALDRATGRRLWTEEGWNACPRGTQLAMWGGWSGPLWLRATKTGMLERSLTETSGRMDNWAFSRDGTRLLAFEPGGVLTVYDAGSGHLVGSAFAPAATRMLALATDPGWLISDGHGRLQSWPRDFGFGAFEVPGWPDAFNAAVLSASGHRSATSDWGRVTVWDTETGAEQWSAPAGRRDVYALAFSPDEQSLALGGKDRRVCILDAATGLPRQSPVEVGSPVTALAWHPVRDANGRRPPERRDPVAGCRSERRRTR